MESFPRIRTNLSWSILSKMSLRCALHTDGRELPARGTRTKNVCLYSFSSHTYVYEKQTGFLWSQFLLAVVPQCRQALGESVLFQPELLFCFSRVSHTS